VGKWSYALEALSEASGSAGAVLIAPEGSMPVLPCSASLEEVCRDYVEEGWVDRDERYKAMATLVRRSVATELDFTSPDAMDRHPYWQEFLAPHGLRWWAGVKIAFGDDIWIASIQRTQQQGPFLPEELDRLRLLSPHLSAAGALARALDFARMESASSAFQASGRAVLFLDQDARVIHLNSAAEALLGNDLQIRNGEIQSFVRDATANLGRVVRSLLDTDTPLLSPVVATLPRRAGRPLLAFLSRPPRDMFEVVGRCRCIISLLDVDRSNELDPHVMKEALGLTNAEARLSNQLYRGVSVREAAATLGISYETARSSLKGIYDKLRVHGYSELSSLVGKIRDHVISME
jgi:DNA-binding CsgD family transcriptional regulator/PAS domain-containing protein